MFGENAITKFSERIIYWDLYFENRSQITEFLGKYRKFKSHKGPSSKLQSDVLMHCPLGIGFDGPNFETIKKGQKFQIMPDFDEENLDTRISYDGWGPFLANYVQGSFIIEHIDDHIAFMFSGGKFWAIEDYQILDIIDSLIYVVFSILGSENAFIITNFVNKYGKNYTDSEIANLWELLISKGLDFHYGQIELMVKKEIYEQDYSEFKHVMNYEDFNFSKEIKNNQISLEKTVEKLLMIYGENYENVIPFFARYLNENNLLKNIKKVGDPKYVNSMFSGFYKTFADKKVYLNSIFNYNIINDIIQEKKHNIELNDFGKDLLEDDFGFNEYYDINDIDQLNGYDFEAFLSVLFKKMGFNVLKTSASSDQGADLIINKFGKKSVVQAKRYKNKVGNKAIQEITAAVPQYDANQGIVVTNSEFTKPAKELAKSNNIVLVNRDKLNALMNRHSIKKNEINF